MSPLRPLQQWKQPNWETGGTTVPAGSPPDPPPTDPPPSGGGSGGAGWTGTTTGNKFASPSGSDSNSGTIGSPYLTVDKLLENLTPGQTGVLRGGTYTTTFTGPGGSGYAMVSGSSSGAGNSGTAGNPITLCNYLNETPLIKGQWYLNSNYVTVRGLSLEWINANISRFCGDNMIFEYCTINAGGDDISGMHIGGTPTAEHAANPIVRRCRIYNVDGPDTDGPPHGIYAAQTSNLLVEQCKIHDILGADPGIRGIQIYPDSTNATVRYCIIDRCKGGLVLEDGNHVIEYTIISNTSTRKGIEITSGTVTSRYCHFYSNSAGDYESGITIVGATFGNPLYTNEAGRVYTPLGSGSPAAGKGTDW